MNSAINYAVNVGLLVAVVAFTFSVLYLPGGSHDDKAFGVFIALALPSVGALANYFLMQETR